MLQYFETQKQFGMPLNDRKEIVLSFADDLTLIVANQASLGRISRELDKKLTQLELHTKSLKF